jgi:hypothetical protein
LTGRQAAPRAGLEALENTKYPTSFLLAGKGAMIKVLRGFPVVIIEEIIFKKKFATFGENLV